ncbi:MAG: heavy-metal-associated domain-containing protein [Saprospiraceae bacterium]
MKHVSLILTILVMSVLHLSATDSNVKTDTFKVYGNCGMCKRTIEKAATSVEGVKSASWDVETDIITVSYNSTVVALDDIKKAIAASGYDSDSHRAPDAVYNKLHGCCQYDRPAPKRQE